MLWRWSEIARDGEGDGSEDAGIDGGSKIAEVFEREISSDAEADEGDALIGRGHMLYDPFQIVPRAAVVGAQ